MAVLFDNIELASVVPTLYVRLLIDGVVQPIYSDAADTPIVAVSGVANAAQTDSRGNYKLHAPAGTYDLEVLDSDATTRLDLVTGVEIVGDLNTELFAPLSFGEKLFPSTGHRLCTEGDSKAQDAGHDLSQALLMWAIATSEADIYYDPAFDNLGIDGSTTGTDATTQTDFYGNAVPKGVNHPTRRARLLAAVARGCDVVYFCCGVNDTPGTDTYANWVSWHSYARSIGVRRVLLNIIDPTTSFTTDSLSREALSRNRQFRDYERDNADVVLVDTSGALTDFGATQYAPVGGAVDAFGSVMTDGLHLSTFGAYQGGRYSLGEALLKIAPRKSGIDLLHPKDLYNGTNALYGNLLANSRFFGGTGTPVGAGTVSGTVPGSWVLAVPSGITVTIAQVASTNLSAKYGRSDINSTRLTLSGTPGADGAIELLSAAGTITGFGTVGTRFHSEILAYCNALTGVSCLSNQLVPNTYGPGIEHWGKRTAGASSQLPPITGLVRLGQPSPYALTSVLVPGAAATSLALGLNIGVKSGVALSGSIQIDYAMLSRAF